MTDTHLLRDLVHIPETVQKSDFVVSLSAGIADADKTLGQYVVTDQVATCFDQALGLIASAIDDKTSKGAYLHGSFGSGKSHFMAVLHLLLQKHAKARAIPQLAPAIAKYAGTLDSANVLLVPYHMVGKQTMEAGVLGGYVEHIRALHPEAPVPPVFTDDKLFTDADAMRANLGDEKFFEGLGGGGGALAGFGDLTGGWDAARFEAARSAPADDQDRRQLAADLIGSYFTSYAELAAGSGSGYVPLDEGLATISRHAKDLGYDAAVLFLDELILWLASRMTDADFVSREGGKVGLLVEGSAPRAIPIVSMIARQRDLKDFIGDGIPGAEKASFLHGMQWWDGRFSTVKLADRNLPAIVEHRVLKPTSESAKATLDAEFERFTKRADRAMSTLVTDDSDLASFRRVYPFSPALVEVLIALGNVLQRERTALRLLMQLLVDRRDELSVGQVVPLGDLWDVIADEDPFDEAMKAHFAKARKLYALKLRPMLLDQHGQTEDTVGTLDPGHAFHADDRLAKTLLVAALVPEATPVRGMTVSRLTDLNHGSIRSPIPGAERANVLTKVRKWAATIPEIRLDGDDQDPSVAIQLVGVDVQSIIDRVSSHDSAGARIRAIRDLLGEAIGVDTRDALLPSYRFVWRGRRREVDLAFANVREPRDLPDGEFRASLDQPKVVIDYPFDIDDERGPQDDLARAQELRLSIGPTPTMCWIPKSLTEKAKASLGRYVCLEFLLTGDRLDQNTEHLPADQRREARDVLKSLRDQLRVQLTDIMRQAYGVTSPDPEHVQDDIDLADQFPVLDAAVTIAPPVATSLKDAFGVLLDQLWASVAPAHPEFPEEVKKGELVRSLELVQEAAAREDRRLELAPADRPLLKKVIGPLKLGIVGEAHFNLDRHWRDHVHRLHASAGGPITAAKLREWFDQPQRMALDEQVGNLLISAYAVETDRILSLDGMTLSPTVDRIDGRVELRTLELCTPEEWEAARRRAPAVFGVDASPTLNAGNVATLSGKIRTKASEHVEACRSLPHALERVAEVVGVPSEAPRRANARAAQTLLDGITAASDDVGVVRFLAAADIPTTPEALATSIARAGQVTAAVERTNLDLLRHAFGLGSEWAGEAGVLRSRLADAVQADQLATDLVPVLVSVTNDATGLMARAAKQPRQDPAPPPPPPTPPPGPELADSGTETFTTDEAAREFLARLQAAGRIRSLEIRWELDR